MVSDWNFCLVNLSSDSGEPGTTNKTHYRKSVALDNYYNLRPDKTDALVAGKIGWTKNQRNYFYHGTAGISADDGFGKKRGQAAPAQR